MFGGAPLGCSWFCCSRIHTNGSCRCMWCLSEAVRLRVPSIRLFMTLLLTHPDGGSVQVCVVQLAETAASCQDGQGNESECRKARPVQCAGICLTIVRHCSLYMLFWGRAGTCSAECVPQSHRGFTVRIGRCMQPLLVCILAQNLCLPAFESPPSCAPALTWFSSTWV